VQLVDAKGVVDIQSAAGNGGISGQCGVGRGLLACVLVVEALQSDMSAVTASRSGWPGLKVCTKVPLAVLKVRLRVAYLWEACGRSTGARDCHSRWLGQNLLTGKVHHVLRCAMMCMPMLMSAAYLLSFRLLVVCCR
jgi:hypothetical protein